MFEADANEQGDGDPNNNEYFKYVNLRAYPRLLDQFLNDNPLERELSREDRLKDHLLVVDQGEDARTFQIVARWAKGKRTFNGR